MEKISHMEYCRNGSAGRIDCDGSGSGSHGAYDYNAYTAQDVIRALNKENRGPEEFKALLSPRRGTLSGGNGAPCDSGNQKAFWKQRISLHAAVHFQLL